MDDMSFEDNQHRRLWCGSVVHFFLPIPSPDFPVCPNTFELNDFGCPRLHRVSTLNKDQSLMVKFRGQDPYILNTVDTRDYR